MVALAAIPSTPPPRPVLRSVEVESTDILVNYLPGVLRQDPFMVNLLRVFDAILRPLMETIDAIDSYLDPELAPSELLPWLAAWVGAEIDERWPESVKRALIKETVGLHRERGTADGLRRALKIVTGQDVLVLENTAGLRLDDGARLGLNTQLSDLEPHTIYVMLQGDTAAVDLEAVHDVIRRMKPAHATYSVRTTEGQIP